MLAKRNRYELITSILIWIGVSSLSWYLVYLKYIGLDFHTRDYAFYTEFIIKWSRSASEQHYSINPGGYNFLGARSIDGCNGFYQWIHLEPIRILQAFIYRIFHSIQAVFVFNALLVCSPILAIPLWLRKTSAGFWEKLVWILLFVAFPATLYTAGYDNRPSMFLGVGYFWILFFFLATKNKCMQYLFFFLLFLVREEALILNGVACIYVFSLWRKKEILLSELLIYFSTFLIYITLLFSYFCYWTTALFQTMAMHYSFNLLGVLFLFCIGWLYYMYSKQKYYQILFLPIVFFLFQIISMYYANMLPDDGFYCYNDPRNTFWFVCLLAFFLYVRANKYKAIGIVAGLFTFVFLILPLLYGDNLFLRINQEKISAIDNSTLFETEKQFSPLDTVITDYNTHQAFIGRNHLYCFQRLPCTIGKTHVRFFPDNIKFLQGFFRRGNWFLANHESFELLKKTDLVNESYIQWENNKYVILRVK